MGSAPSDELVRALESEAYAALLRAVYAHPGGVSDPFVSILDLKMSIIIICSLSRLNNL